MVYCVVYCSTVALPICLFNKSQASCHGHSIGYKVEFSLEIPAHPVPEEEVQSGRLSDSYAQPAQIVQCIYDVPP